MKKKAKLFGGSHSENMARQRQVNLIHEDRSHILNPTSDFFIRESYKTLRTNVSFSLAGEEGHKMILVTSALQGEGKSITALNLAVSYAQTDRKVLIVDCDLRRPKLARLLQLKGSTGLSNVLMSPELLRQSVVPSGMPNLDVLPAGDIPPNPSELLSSPRMQKLLEVLREKYDYVVLDTPPVDMVIDAVVLAPHSDGVLFVVFANRSERGAVMHAVEQLEYGKAKIMGFVLNAVSPENSNYAYGKYRKRGYRRYKGYGYKSRAYGYGGYGRVPYGYGYGYTASSAASGREAGEG